MKTSRNNEGWIAEYMIPFTTLRFNSSPSQEWGLQITRRVPRINEEAHWSPLPQRYGNFRMSLAGTLRGLENIRQGRNLRVKPYVSAGITQSRGTDGQMQTVQGLGRLKDYDGGVDLKYSITPSLTLDATEYNEVEPNFNPEVGFIRRRDMKQYSGEFIYRPLMRRSESIRNLNFGNQFDYFAGSGSGKVETRTNETTMGVIFETNASVNFIINQTFDRLAEPLRIPSGNPHVAIPRGDYKFENYTGNFTTNQRRKVAGNGAYNWGDFYNGKHRQVTAGLSVKPNYHLTMNLTYDRNRVRTHGSFTTKLIGAKLIYGFTPRAFFNAFIQYNADTHLVSSNIRFNWTHHPHSDLYIVYNDTYNTLTNQARERAFIIKLTNLFRS